MAENGTLTTKQRLAVVALLEERTVTGAAKRAGVGAKTLFVWLTQPAFRAELSKAESAAIDDAVRALVRTSGAAIAVLEKTMTDAGATASTRVRAAQAILDNLLKLREHLTLDERVSRLEAAQHERLR